MRAVVDSRARGKRNTKWVRTNVNRLRVWANQKFIDYKIWLARREAYKERTLVVSNHWDGSVQVFYHFLLGYFAPLSAWLRKSGTRKIAVRDCGPMNVWFEFLAPEIDVQIIKPGVALFAFAGNRTRSHVVTGLDYPTKHKRKKLERARESMRRYIPTINIEATPILVIDRASSDEFHSGPDSETEMSGARRRSVPNLSTVCADLFIPDSYQVADMAHIPPVNQVALASRASILLGQHGAGLTHMIWMPKGSTVIEIHPPLPDEAIDVFRLLAQSLGHTYVRIAQTEVHADIDPVLLQATIRMYFPEYLSS